MFQFLFCYILERKDKKWFKRDIIVLISFLILFVSISFLVNIGKEMSLPGFRSFRSKDDFLSRLVTVYETLVQYYEPENKGQSSVGRAWIPEAKEVQDTTICRQSDGDSILGPKGVITKEKYNNWIVLCKLARPAENRYP